MASVGPVALTFICVGILVIVYAPWNSTALELRDFSEFVPLLRQADSVPAQWDTLNEYYRSQGRGNVLTNGLIAIGWTIAGTSPRTWQAYQFVLLAVAAAGLLSYLLQSGLSRPLALALTVAVACNSSLTAATFRLSAELPIASLVIAWALLTRTRIHLLLFSGLAAAIVCSILLFKEAMVVLIPFLLGLSLSSSADRVTKTATAGTTAVVALFLFARAVLIDADAPATAYSQGFTLSTVSWPLLIVTGICIFSPAAWPWNSLTEVLSSPHSLAWIFLVGSGLWVSIRRDRGLVALGFIVTLVASTLVYTAWGRFEMFYSAPILMAGALVVAQNLKAVAARPLGRVSCWLAVVVLVSSAVPESLLFGQHTAARRSVEFEVAERLQAAGPQREVRFFSSSIASQEWQQHGATFARYIGALWPGSLAPATRTDRCADAPEATDRVDAVVVYPASDCDHILTDDAVQAQFSGYLLVPPRRVQGTFALLTRNLPPKVINQPTRFD